MKNQNTQHKFITDVLAGLTVSFAALSLGAAFGVLSGRGALSGMIGASIIPIIASAFGGTRIQASGPTAPMTTVTALIVAFAYEKFGHATPIAEQLITLTILLSAALIILMGVFRLGRFIQMVPQVVVLGFMNGIAALIWVDQIQKLFGLGGKTRIEGDLMTNLLLAISTLVLIFAIPRLLKWLRIPGIVRKFMPGILFTIIFVTVVSVMGNLNVGRVQLGGKIESLNDLKSMITDFFPTSSQLYTVENFKLIIPFVLQLSLLAYLDSLLTSLVVDRMTNEKTNPDKELVAQGFANGASGLLQGIPGAQATIRSVLLVKEGASSRLAGILVGVFALIGFLLFSNLVTLIASAVFVAVLLKVGLDVVDKEFFEAYFQRKFYKNWERNIQMAFVIYTTVVTVLIDLNMAVITGTLLFYVSRYFFKINDVESDFSEVHSYDILEDHDNEE